MNDAEQFCDNIKSKQTSVKKSRFTKYLLMFFIFIMAFTFSFLMFTMFIFPVFNDKREGNVQETPFYDILETISPTGSFGQTVDKGAFIHWYAPENTFGISHYSVLNTSYFENWTAQYFNVSLKASPNGNNWYDADIGLTEIWTWNHTNGSRAKISWIVNTSEANNPYYYRLIVGIDVRCKRFINGSISDSQVQFDFPVGGNDTYSLFLNWSDIVPLIQNDKITVKRGTKTIGNNSYFYAILETVDKLNPDIVFEIDPLFGYSGSGSGGRASMSNRLTASFAMPTSSGVAKNITVRCLVFGGYDSRVKCALYEYVDHSSTYAGALLGYTEEYNISATGVYIFNLTEDVNITEGIKYYVSVWSDNEPSGDGNIYGYDANPGTSCWQYRSYTGGAFPNPWTGESNPTEVLSIWCSYTENTTIGYLGNETSYPYYKEITINSTLVDGDLVNFPILFSNTSSDFASNMRPDAYDAVFTSADNNTVYNHEIELYNATTGQLIAWVNVTDLDGDADSTMYLHYGNGTTGTNEHITDTWDSNFVGVWHMQDDYSIDTGVEDSTSYGNDGLKESGYNETGLPIEVSGMVGYAQEFETNKPREVGLVGSLLDCGTSNTLQGASNLTLESWSYATDAKESYVIMDRHHPATSWEITAQASNYRIQQGGWMNWVTGDRDINCWEYIVVTREYPMVQFFDNGTYGSQNTRTTNNTASGVHCYIAGDHVWSPTAGYQQRADFNGSIDEVRISNNNRSNAWIKTTHDTIRYPTLFLSVGAEQTAEEEEPTRSWNNSFDFNVSFGNITGFGYQFSFNISFSNTSIRSWNNTFDFNVSFSNTTGYNNVFDFNISFSNTSLRTWNNTFDFNVSFSNTTGYNNVFDFNVSFSNTSIRTWGNPFSFNVSFSNTTNYQNPFDFNVSFGNTTIYGNPFDFNISFSNTSVRTWQNNFDFNISFSNSTGFRYQFSFNVSFSNSTPPPPILITNIYPSNSSFNIPLQPYVYATFSHQEGSTMNISWYNDITLLGTESSVNNGTYSELFLVAVNRSTNYTLNITVNDELGTWVNETIEFRTERRSVGMTESNNVLTFVFAVIGLLGLFGGLGYIRRRRKRS